MSNTHTGQNHRGTESGPDPGLNRAGQWDTRRVNIAAAKALRDALRTTLGPRGMDKMLIEPSGPSDKPRLTPEDTTASTRGSGWKTEEVVVTNDGATILEQLATDHPVADLFVDLADCQRERVGDGTTTAVVLAGELLGEAERLLSEGIAPATIAEGFREGARLAASVIDQRTIDEVRSDGFLRQAIETYLTGKGTGGIATADLAETVTRAIERVDQGAGCDRDSVRVYGQVGRGAAATDIVDGAIVNGRRPAHVNMPRSVEDATVTVLDFELEVRESRRDLDTAHAIDAVDGLSEAVGGELAQLRQYADALVSAGVDAVIVSDNGRLAEPVAAALADHGIIAFDRVQETYADAVARATGATRIGDPGVLDRIQRDDFGHAARVRSETVGQAALGFVEPGPDSGMVTVFARGGTEHVVEELRRTLEAGIDVAFAVYNNGLVPGAGATEVAIATELRDAATRVDDRKQLVIEAFADAVTILPRTIAETGGAATVDVLADLRRAFAAGNRAGVVVDGTTVTVADPLEYGIVDAAGCKHNAVYSAADIAATIVSVDQIVFTDH